MSAWVRPGLVRVSCTAFTRTPDSYTQVKRRKRKKQHILVPIQPGKDSFAKTELIYYAKSPDYCYPDEKTGSVGTRGRWVFVKVCVRLVGAR